MANQGKKWTIKPEDQKKVKQLLIDLGGEEVDVAKNPHLEWRVKIGKSLFDYFTNGTLYNNQATSDTVLDAREKISEFSTSNLQDTNRDIKIGLDETGKGELFGHEVLCAVSYPNSISQELEEVVGLANTKSRRSFDYWDNVVSRLDKLQAKGLNFVTHSIPPWDIDRYNVNKIMDVTYKKLISDIIIGLPMNQSSLVIDNYQIDDNLNFFLKGLESQGMIVKIEEKADDKFLESKLASIIAKWQRERMMKGINERFAINGSPPGTGNLSDQQTQKWLVDWKASGQEWPWFVKKSVITIRKMDGYSTKVKKVEPPIRHSLIPKEIRQSFDEGKLSTTALRIACPECGSELNAIKLTPNQSMQLEGRCITCSKVIRDLKTTLFYYNGRIVPDSSAILSGMISKDLNKGKFFEDFTMLLHPRVLEECDNTGGKAELGRMSDIANAGRIKQITLQDMINYDSKADDEIVAAAKKYNAIILTKDKGQYAKATGFDQFILT